MQCKEWDDANSELFKESHDEAVHKNSYKSRLYELISASIVLPLYGTVGRESICLTEVSCRYETQRCHVEQETICEKFPVGKKQQWSHA